MRVLATFVQSHGDGRASGPGIVEELLHANVLPHLSGGPSKMQFLAHMVGVLLNAMFDPVSHRSQLFDKDFIDHGHIAIQ